MKADKFKVIVEFSVEAEKLGPWTAEQCARDFVRHRIDEGYQLEEQILDWKFLEVKKVIS
jgi:hypothetical protein